MERGKRKPRDEGKWRGERGVGKEWGMGIGEKEVRGGNGEFNVHISHLTFQLRRMRDSVSTLHT